MRIRLLTLCALLLCGSAASAADIRGAWTALVKGDRVHLNVVRDHSNWGRSMPRAEFGLSDSQLNSASETPVHFAFTRDAGTIDFNGTFQNGEGVGRFTFTPSRSYAETLRSLNVPADSHFDDEDLFSLAMHDVSIAFIRDMQSLGYRQSLDQYIAFRIHGVTTDFVRELRSLGYDKLLADDLVAFRIHGVTSEFVRAMRDLGVKDLSADQLVAMRIHGVTIDYVRELRDLGYSGLLSDDLVAMRIHGVTTRFIRDFADAGYHNIPVDKLVEMRIHGIQAPKSARQ
jgi:hypothetical protein